MAIQPIRQAIRNVTIRSRHQLQIADSARYWFAFRPELHPHISAVYGQAPA
jgi:hypothetical protein